MADDLRESALDYHRYPRPGKLAIQATKPLASQRDLSLAYSPGVAAACEEIVGDPLQAAAYTSRGNLVAVVSNGTAVFDIEIEERDTDAAFSESIRRRLLPKSRLGGEANLLIMPNRDSANITFNALKAVGNGVSVGPILLGAARPVHVLNRTVTARGIVNMSAFAVVEAQAHGA